MFELIGNMLINIGIFITPISFVAYLITSWLQYVWRLPQYTKLGKVFWYLAVGLGEVTNDARFEMFVFLMIFMDCSDSLFEFLNERRALRETN